MIHGKFSKLFSSLWTIKTNVNGSNFLRTNFSFNSKHGFNANPFIWNKKQLYVLATVGYVSYYLHNNKYHVHAARFSRPSSCLKNIPNPQDYNTPLCFKHSPIPQRPELPTYTKAQVDENCWLIYENGVYDITSFIGQHEKEAENNIVEGKLTGVNAGPFHYQTDILESLEKYRIGNLSKEDYQVELKKNIHTDEIGKSYWNFAPLSHPLHDKKAGTLSYTHPAIPGNMNIIRTGGRAPVIDLDKYTLEVAVKGKNETLVLSFDELKKFPKHSVNATVLCANINKDEIMNHKPKENNTADNETSGNLIWSGVKLRDILEKAGFTEDDIQEYQYVKLDGMDTDIEGEHFGTSIPLSKALDKKGDVILAYEMNGSPIPLEHGFPVRAIVPGFTGARSVKWLHRIEVQKDDNDLTPSTSFPQNVNYVQWSEAAVNELPVTSAICHPGNGEDVKVCDGKITVKGYAHSGRGQRIIKVVVSNDEGATWHPADFTYQSDEKPPQHYAWTLWSAELPVKTTWDSCSIWVKATDSCYNTQPESLDHVENSSLRECNTLHKIQVNLI